MKLSQKSATGLGENLILFLSLCPPLNFHIPLTTNHTKKAFARLVPRSPAWLCLKTSMTITFLQKKMRKLTARKEGGVGSQSHIRAKMGNGFNHARNRDSSPWSGLITARKVCAAHCAPVLSSSWPQQGWEPQWWCKANWDVPQIKHTPIPSFAAEQPQLRPSAALRKISVLPHVPSTAGEWQINHSAWVSALLSTLCIAFEPMSWGGRFWQEALL